MNVYTSLFLVILLHSTSILSAKEILGMAAYQVFRVFALSAFYVNIDSIWHDEWTFRQTMRWIVAEVLAVEILMRIF